MYKTNKDFFICKYNFIKIEPIYVFFFFLLIQLNIRHCTNNRILNPNTRSLQNTRFITIECKSFLLIEEVTCVYTQNFLQKELFFSLIKFFVLCFHK